jgi:hypothetical protein
MKLKLELSRGDAVLEGNCAECDAELFYKPTVRVDCGHHVCVGCSKNFSVDSNCPFCVESEREVIRALKLKKIDAQSDQMD